MALIGWDNLVEAPDTLVSATAEAVGLGAQNLRIPLGDPSVAWQTPLGTTVASVLLVRPAAAPWRALCLARTNLSPSAFIQVRVGTRTGVATSPTYSSGLLAAGVVPGVRQVLHVLPPAVSGEALLLDVLDPTNPDGFLNVPLLFAGDVVDFVIAAAPERPLDLRRFDAQGRGGALFTDRGEPSRGWNFRVADLPDERAGFLPTLESFAASGRNVLFVPLWPHARAAADAVFGPLDPGPGGFADLVGAHRTWSATIRERL